MKKIKKSSLKKLFIFPLLLASLASCSGNNSNVSGSDETIYVHVLNAEDYIDESLLDVFSEYILERDNKNVVVIWDTYDTNETMYNTLQTGKATYDLICASEYMVQRLANENMLTKLPFESLPNYSNYVSHFLHDPENINPGKMNLLTVNNDEGTTNLGEYAAGYMWGTLGILYNPEYVLNQNGNLFNEDPRFKDLSYDERVEKIIEIFNSDDGYSFLWDDLIAGTQSIKDSMRDTFAVGNFEVFKDYYLNTNDDYEARNEKFNDSSDETIELIKNKLIELKSNIFGFEVDSGKNDIVTQKIGVNLAWSGDAVNSINRGFYADDDWTEEREDPVDLYFAIPSIGANVWMDVWCTPKIDEEGYYDSETYKYTLEFLDFLSTPENAILNVDYNGYTSFITSSNLDNSDTSLSMLAYMLYCYDLSDGDDDEDLSQYDSYDISSFFNFEEEFSVDLSYVSGEIFEDEEVDDRVFTFKKDENGNVPIIIHTDMNSFEGRLLRAQYPNEEDIETLYVMNDFGDQNDRIVQMWEDVKVNPLPLWITITLIVFIVIFIGYLGSYKLIRVAKLKYRKKLREEAKRNN